MSLGFVTGYVLGLHGRVALLGGAAGELLRKEGSNIVITWFFIYLKIVPEFL